MVQANWPLFKMAANFKVFIRGSDNSVINKVNTNITTHLNYILTIFIFLNRVQQVDSSFLI